MRKNELVFPAHNQSALKVKTGDWRTLRPEIRVKNSACSANCPIGNKIRDVLRLARQGQFYEAWQIYLETNPLPAILGRICPHPCEDACLRAQFDEPLAINLMERTLGEMAFEKKWKPEVPALTPRLLARHRIAIIGAGPAGLSCAYQLRRLGWWVDIFEAEKFPGGLLYFGIPAYRLPKDLLRQEIENNILSLDGISLHTNICVNNLLWHHFPSDFDTVVIAIGNTKSRKLNIEGEDKNNQVISGLDFLRKINLGGEAGVANENIAVVGGGNTAIDTARSAKMAGAKEVFILYRRREEDMPALKEEIESAKKEGVEIMTLVAPALIEKRCDGILRIECLRMKLGQPDKSGRPEPVPLPDSRFAAFCHKLIVAAGEETDLSFMSGFGDEKLPFENVFVAGDVSMYGKGGTVAAAIGSGNRAAEEIDFYLRTGKRKDVLTGQETFVQFSDLNPEYFEYGRSRLRIHPLGADQGVLEQLIQEEAERCFSCGDCNSCGNCWLFCPDVAVKETKNDYEIDYDYCKGCGICANECPRNAIEMSMSFGCAQGREVKE